MHTARHLVAHVLVLVHLVWATLRHFKSDRDEI